MILYIPNLSHTLAITFIPIMLLLYSKSHTVLYELFIVCWVDVSTCRLPATLVLATESLTDE